MSEMGTAFGESVRKCIEGRHVAVAFSGGLDSGMVAAFAGKYAESVMLYTVGYGESYDSKMADDMASKLDLDIEHIPINENDIFDILREMISVTGTRSPLTLAFEFPLFLVCRGCKEKDIIGGQGADELFGGYSKYVGLSEIDFRNSTEADMAKLLDETIPHESKMAAHFGKTIHYPFLDDRFVDVVRKTDIAELMPKDQDSRKAPLKAMAYEYGYPFIADKKKKAAQYGSGFMDAIRKVSRAEGCTYSQKVADICNEVLR